MPLSSPRTSPILVERDDELAALDRLLMGAGEGQGRFALLGGDAGVGKSRLVRECLPRAADRGFEILIGGCSERDREFPFAPVVDALRQRLATTGETAGALLGSQAEALAELLPEHRLDLVSGSPFPLPPEHGKRRLFEAIVALFGRLAAQRPLLIVLEDLHWADPTSLELLELLPRRLATARVLLLGTARFDELNPDLARWLAALHRARAVTELSLAPLTEQGVTQMVDALLPALPPPAVVATVWARSAGNPFFVEELLAAMPVSGAWLAAQSIVPATVREAVLRRLDGIDPMAARVADLAAVAGERMDFDLLRGAGGLAEADLLAAVRALVERRVLVEGGTAGEPELAFRHALTRDALRDHLLHAERRALHHAVGEALEATAREPIPPAVAGDLGYHFHAAGVWDKAIAYAARAGEAARAVHSSVEALAHDRRALDAAVALGDPRRAKLHWRCGQALALLGAFDAARDHLEQARSAARDRGLADVEQAALYDLAGLFASRDYGAARRLAEEALGAARTARDRRREGLSLNRLGNVLTNVSRFAEGRALHEDALAIFEALDDPWGTADSLDLIGMARYLTGEVPEARDAFGRAAAVFEELGDQVRVASALTSRGLYLAVLDGPCAADAPPAAFRADAERGLRLCREIGWRVGEAYARVAVATCDLGEGRYEEAARQAEMAVAIAAEIDHLQWTVIALLTLGILHADLLDDALALERFERAVALAQVIGATQWVERLEAWVWRSRSRLGDASAPDPPPAALPSGAAPATIGQRRTLFALAERQLAGGHHEAALATVDRLLLGATGPRPAATVLLRAETLAALGRSEEADAAYLEARRLAREFGPAAVRWRTAAGRARLWRGRDPERAAAEAATAHAEVAAVAATIPDEGWRATFLAAPEIGPWTVPGGRQRTLPTAAFGGLTAREREVVRLVAAGRSNREIADALFISVPTVKRHLTTVLGKLGLPSRSALNTYAHTHGFA